MLLRAMVRSLGSAAGAHFLRPALQDVPMGCEGQRRQSLRREPADLLYLIGRDRAASDQPRAVVQADDALVRLQDVQDGHQLEWLDIDPDFFATLADHRLLRVLIPIDKPSGEAPEAAAGIDITLDQQDATAVLDDGCGNDLRVTEKDPVTRRAGAELLPSDLSFLGWGSAAGAVRDH